MNASSIGVRARPCLPCGLWVLALACAACSSSSDRHREPDASAHAGSSGGTIGAAANGGQSGNGADGGLGGSGDSAQSSRDASLGASMSDSATATTNDAALSSDASTTSLDGSLIVDAAAPTVTMFAGVDVHNYPKPTAYGYTQADGADRMGNALVMLGATQVRGLTIGDTTFIARLASFGVRRVVLGLDAKSYGKPFDPTLLATALDNSLAAAKTAKVEVVVEGLNEWDLFNSKSYNNGVIPTGKSVSDFVLITQQALYAAAHPKGIKVLGPSVGHPDKAASYALFPDVSAYVDIINMHLYYGASPQTLPIADRVHSHEQFQGAGKPVWITETGWSVYNGVTLQQQASIIETGLATFEHSGLIAAAFNYELIDDQKPGVSGTSIVPDSAEYHFGLFTYEGVAKPSAAVVHDFIAAH